ncbi:hypothetical protein H0H92_007819 [Tricholoma furcatifolium]|nr:hypothetical protein H0H92_007819 [Tricholoma furcatifolium]
MSRFDLQTQNDELREHLSRAQVHHKAQNMIIEGAHAQLVVQNLHLQKLNRAQERDKKEEQLQEEEAAQRARNAETRASKREAIACVEEEWMRIKEAHAATYVSAWETECQKLGSEGVPKKEWPRKPTRPRKPQVSTTEQVPEEEDDEQEGIEDEEED